MPTRRRFAGLALVLALGLVASESSAEVSVRNAWIAATVKGQQSSAAFMQLESEEACVLTGARTPSAAMVGVHAMSIEDGVMKMRDLDTLPLPARQTVELKPGGAHLMMMDLKQQLKAGQSIPLVLGFECSGQAAGKRAFEQKLLVPVRDRARGQ